MPRWSQERIVHCSLDVRDTSSGCERLLSTANVDARFTERLYARYASLYDQLCGPILQAGRREAMRDLRLVPGDDILEIGIGTALTAPLYPRACHVTGIDLSAPMLREAAKHIDSQPGRGLAPVWWTSFERWIRCRPWQTGNRNEPGVASPRSSRPARCAWFWMRANRWARRPAISTSPSRRCAIGSSRPAPTAARASLASGRAASSKSSGACGRKCASCAWNGTC